MKSSYQNKLDYSDLISSLVFLVKPKRIIEFGILEGYSLQTMADNITSDCEIIAYDIFDKFDGNSAKQDNLLTKFKNYSNVSILYGDFYEQFNNIEDESIDILHIDIANNGDIVEFVFQNYISKLTSHGILILEGGSLARDNIEWMNKYNKPKIYPILQKYKEKYDILTLGEIPSITIVKKK
jgi:predicted O-methyltransferase YrrM